MKTLATFLVWIGSLFLHGCSVTSAYGIKPDDVSQFQIGSSREQVEQLLDAPIEVSECPDGTRAKYVYDRGHPPADNPGLMATVGGVFSLITFGAMEPAISCIYTCQRGTLEIIFDHNDTVVLLRPHPDAYDVGWLCDGGDVFREVCKSAQSDASKTDPARLIQAQDNLLIETGCFQHFSSVCQLAHNKDPRRQHDMGVFYRDGKLPVSESPINAYMWFSLAMQGGVLYAEVSRDKVAKKLSADELAEAERLVSEWAPNPVECGKNKAPSASGRHDRGPLIAWNTAGYF